MKKTSIIAGVVICIVVICAIYFMKDIKKTPVDILRSNFADEPAPFRLSTVIEQIDIDNKTTLVFYYTDNGGIANAILEKGLLGYKVVNYSGEVAPFNERVSTSRFFSSYGESKSIIWYVLYDQNITRVMVGGNEASIFTVDNIKMYYLLNDYAEPPPAEYYNGDELVWVIE